MWVKIFFFRGVVKVEFFFPLFDDDDDDDDGDDNPERSIIKLLPSFLRSF